MRDAPFYHTLLFDTMAKMRIRGKVRRGKGRGKDLGFPTANIAIRKKISEGVYLSETTVNGKTHPSLTFVGAAKTFDESDYHAESYMLSFDENLYDRWITIHLLKRLRGNKKFSSKEALIEQMQRDEKDAIMYFGTAHE